MYPKTIFQDFKILQRELTELGWNHEKKHVQKKIVCLLERDCLSAVLSEFSNALPLSRHIIAEVNTNVVFSRRTLRPQFFSSLCDPRCVRNRCERIDREMSSSCCHCVDLQLQVHVLRQYPANDRANVSRT